MIDTRDLSRVRWILVAYVVVLSVGLAGQAWFRPELWSTWLFTWAAAVVAPAVGVEHSARRLRQTPVDSRLTRQLLLAPMAVSAIMIVTLFEVVLELGRH